MHGPLKVKLAMLHRVCT